MKISVLYSQDKTITNSNAENTLLKHGSNLTISPSI